jgi:sarcosine oxidase subunit delta
MLLISCPYCGPRDEVEYRYGGPSHLVRPGPPDAVSDEVWAAYLFGRDNPKGESSERWVHAAGCGQWFNLRRNTVTHEILGAYKMGEAAPGAAAGSVS